MTRHVVRHVLAGVVLLAAPLAPGVIATGHAVQFARLPIETVLAVVLLALLPWRIVRRVVAGVVGAGIAAAAGASVLDRLFRQNVGRSFDVVSDWPAVRDGYGVLQDSAGAVGAAAIAIGLALALVATAALVALALLDVDGLVRRHRRAAVPAVFAGVAAWLALTLVGAQITPGRPVAADDVVGTVSAQSTTAAATLRSDAAFARSAGTDAAASIPTSKLLTGLRGKDVVVAFVESYGQVAVQGTPFSTGVDRVLRAGNAQLAADGWSSRSAFLDSPTFGGISWLAHSTLETGQWIDSQQRYDQVTSGSRFTLASAFRKAGWHTVSDVPSDAKPWAVGTDFYHFDEQLDSTNVGYVGPRFSYARIPDQYTWAAFQRQELSGPHDPVMAEIDLDSSHTPWTPLPSEVPWSSVGDGSVYDPQPAQGLAPSVVWQSRQHVQQLYGQSVEYTMSTLFSFLHTFDDPNLVLVVLGDHQPNAEVSGASANHEVPISIIAKDPAVTDRIAGWRWQPGMLPSPTAPVWPMDAFRDRFLQAYDG